MAASILEIIPVLPSANIERDILWYHQQAGFECRFSDKMYAVLYRGKTFIHLQWHADTSNDPLLGGSVIRIVVDEIETIFEEFVQRNTVSKEKLVRNTPWGTHEFGFFDLNKNGIFIAEELS